MGDDGDALKRLKPDVDAAEQRWLAFWQHELIDRPCCMIVAPREGMDPTPAPPYMAGAHGDFDPVVEQALAWGRSTYWAGDAIPCYTPSFGPDMFASWLGAELVFPEDGHGTSWALPALAEEAAYLGRCIMHYDGPEMLVHLDDICAIEGLECIQWQPGAGNRPFIEWMDLLQEIQSRGVAVYVPCQADAIPVYHRALRPELVCYHCTARSQQEADDALRWLEAHT